MRYDLLALDLDGTLVDHTGRVPEANLRAVRRAREAGVRVAICTGRALIECRGVLEQIGPVDAAIVSGGALTSCPATGDTLERCALDPDLVTMLCDHLHDRGHPALLLKDPHACDYDYLIVTTEGPEAVDPATRWWLRQLGARWRFVPFIEDDPDPDDTVRVGAYTAGGPIHDLVAHLRARFAGRVQLVHFDGIPLPREHHDDGIDTTHIVECFHPRANKWQALSRLAHRLGVPVARVAAIGDQTNDVDMIRHAGLGVAMGNAIEAVASVARRRTLRAEEAGVAHAIDRMLAGEW